MVLGWSPGPKEIISSDLKIYNMNLKIKMSFIF